VDISNILSESDGADKDALVAILKDLEKLHDRKEEILHSMKAKRKGMEKKEAEFTAFMDKCSTLYGGPDGFPRDATHIFKELAGIDAATIRRADPERVLSYLQFWKTKHCRMLDGLQDLKDYAKMCHEEFNKEEAVIQDWQREVGQVDEGIIECVRRKEEILLKKREPGESEDLINSVRKTRGNNKDKRTALGSAQWISDDKQNWKLGSLTVRYVNMFTTFSM